MLNTVEDLKEMNKKLMKLVKNPNLQNPEIDGLENFKKKRNATSKKKKHKLYKTKKCRFGIKCRAKMDCTFIHSKEDEDIF